MFKLTDQNLGSFDFDDQSNGVVVTRKDFGWPSIRESAYDYPDDHGQIDNTAYFGTRVIAIEGYILNTSDTPRTETLARIRRFCVPRARPRLSFTMDGFSTELQADLRVDQQSVPVDSWNNFHFNFTWKTNPFFESVAYSGVAPLAGSGITPNDIWGAPFFPIEFTAGVAASFSLTNNGIENSWPTLYIYGPIRDPEISNTTSAKSLKFSGLTITAGNALYIDTKNRTATSTVDNSDVAGLIDYTTSEWWSLVTGHNTIMLEGSDTGAGTQAVMTWHDLYLG